MPKEEIYKNEHNNKIYTARHGNLEGVAMTDLIEIDMALLSLMSDRNTAKEEKQKRFKDIIRLYKTSFNLDISTEYIRALLISNGTDHRNATIKVSKFTGRNDIKPSVEKVIGVKPLRWLGYCESGFNGENRINENTLSFFAGNN